MRFLLFYSPKVPVTRATFFFNLSSKIAALQVETSVACITKFVTNLIIEFYQLG